MATQARAKRKGPQEPRGELIVTATTHTIPAVYTRYLGDNELPLPPTTRAPAFVRFDRYSIEFFLSLFVGYPIDDELFNIVLNDARARTLRIRCQGEPKYPVPITKGPTIDVELTSDNKVAEITYWT